ncbi:MAG TPA: hypothetical protein VJB94_02670 [Candidatus Nanoarchaeia archaeon]|nr:hypothetical protein [Candidatus Nanoarchaeia archaeon]
MIESYTRKVRPDYNSAVLDKEKDFGNLNELESIVLEDKPLVPTRDGVKTLGGKSAIEINNAWICAYYVLVAIKDC